VCLGMCNLMLTSEQNKKNTLEKDKLKYFMVLEILYLRGWSSPYEIVSYSSMSLPQLLFEHVFNKYVCFEVCFDSGKSFRPNYSNKNGKEILFVFVTSDY